MAINFTKTVLKKNNNSDKKRKYALCFRPVATDGSVLGEPEYKYYTVGNKNGEANSVLLEEKGKNIEELGLRCGKKGRGRLSRALRAVFFQASLAKKNRKKILHEKVMKAPEYDSPRYHQVSLSITSSEDEQNHGSPTRKRKTTPAWEGSSSLYCSSYNSSLLSDSINYSTKRDERSFEISSDGNEHEQQVQSSNYNNDINIGLCMLLISLSVLVIWGKVCAIICTSTWLFFVPRAIAIKQNDHHWPTNFIGKY